MRIYLLAVSLFFFPAVVLNGAEMVIEYGATSATPCVVKMIDDSKTDPGSIYSQVDGHPLVTWATLARFPYDVPGKDEQANPGLRKKDKYPIPEAVKKLNGQNVAVAGYMVPLEVRAEDGKAASFMLVRSQMTCCFGIAPKMNEWVFVQMGKEGAAKVVMDIPVTAFGVLSVGEDYSGQWTLYRMTADKTSYPRGW